MKFASLEHVVYMNCSECQKKTKCFWKRFTCNLENPTLAIFEDYLLLVRPKHELHKEGHKIWKKHLSIYLTFLSNVETIGRFFQNFVTFSEYLNFMNLRYSLFLRGWVGRKKLFQVHFFVTYIHTSYNNVPINGNNNSLMEGKRGRLRCVRPPRPPFMIGFRP